MARPRAAIEIGTHTARLLIAPDPGQSGNPGALARKRAYIRLSEDFDYSEKKIIQSDSTNRTLNVLQDFLCDIKAFNVRSIHAIATGVVREAINRDEFLGRIYEETGIRVKLITGDEEALLTAKGVLHALGVQTSPFLIFDLGGGSTEFFFGGKDTPSVKSTPLGAVILTKGYLKSDPPKRTQVDVLSGYIDRTLEKSSLEFTRKDEQIYVVGTGGTVTTLALMHHGISTKEASAKRINGLTLKRKQIEALFDKLSAMNFEDRVKLPGLDKGRAGIVLAGSLVVIRILHFLKALELTVSMSDLLEGILIDNTEGEYNG